MRQPGAPIICKPTGVARQQRDAAVANHTDGVGIALEGLQLEAGEIDALELFGRIRHGGRRQH